LRIAFGLRLVALLGRVGRIVWFVRIVKIVEGGVFGVFGHGVLQGERFASGAWLKRGGTKLRGEARPRRGCASRCLAANASVNSVIT
jgi:hypothetical protein